MQNRTKKNTGWGSALKQFGSDWASTGHTFVSDWADHRKYGRPKRKNTKRDSKRKWHK